MNWYIKALKKYAVFGGRAHRTEYWMFVLFNIIITIALGVIEGFLGIASDTDQSVLGAIYQLAVLIPSIAVGVRRMHDTDHSGWWWLVPIVSLVFLVTKGTQGENRYGPAPRL
ncbi:MAG: DUF805 domain-containing protein [Symploca sp. SIO2G7]|nr:DUF805 domain-containing protein [Symploca sp. SIO2G7]